MEAVALGSKFLDLFSKDQRSATIHPSLIRMADYLARMMPLPAAPKKPHWKSRRKRDRDPAPPPAPRNRRAEWVNRFLAAYTRLPEGGQAQLDAFVLWLLRFILELISPEGVVLQVIEMAIRCVETGEDNAEAIHRLLRDSRTEAWYAYSACLRHDPEEARRMLVRTVELVTKPSAKAVPSSPAAGWSSSSWLNRSNSATDRITRH
jgi:hypothetical protein